MADTAVFWEQPFPGILKLCVVLLWQVVVMSPPPPLPGSPYQQAAPPKWEEEEEQPDETNTGDDRLGSKWCCVPLAISFLFLVNVLNYIDRGIVPGSSKEFVR